LETSSTNFTDQMPFLQLSQQCQSTEENTKCQYKPGKITCCSHPSLFLITTGLLTEPMLFPVHQLSISSTSLCLCSAQF